MASSASDSRVISTFKKYFLTKEKHFITKKKFRRHAKPRAGRVYGRTAPEGAEEKLGTQESPML